MKQYISNYVITMQVTYPSIMARLIDVFRHLLFVTGNGFTFKDGNPQERDLDDNLVSLETFYNKPLVLEHAIAERKDSDDFAKHVSYLASIKTQRNNFYKRMVDKDASFTKDILAEDQLLAEAVNEALRDLNAIEPLPYDLNKLVDDTYWLNQICKSKHFPTLYLDRTYSPITKLTEQTEQSLLAITLSIARAYIKFYNEITDDLFPLYKHLEIGKTCVADADNLRAKAKADAEILQEQVDRLIKVVFECLK